MFERSSPPRDRVTVHLDGKAIEAERGEPLAVALLAAGESSMARSTKLHRPRGPACLRGDCEGCVARVDGVPNVMTCLRRAKGGERIDVQNVLGSKDTDLLRVTDWFFPKGIDHHHLLAGIPGVSDVMQSFARRMAGVGRLPTEVAPPKPAKREAVDVLVVGAGIAGAAAASALAARGLRVVMADDQAKEGGAARAGGDRARAVLARNDLGKVDHRRETTVVGVYLGEAVLASADGASVVTPRALVLATGAHDGAIAVPNNDLPGVMSARAVALLASYGVRPKEPIAIVGDGPWAARVRELFGERVAVELPIAELESIRGGSRVKGITDRAGKTTRVSVVAIAAPGAPSFELAESVGARVELRAGGFAVVTAADGKAAEGAWAAGECTGIAFDADALERAGKAVAESVARALG